MMAPACKQPTHRPRRFTSSTRGGVGCGDGGFTVGWFVPACALCMSFPVLLPFAMCPFALLFALLSLALTLSTWSSLVHGTGERRQRAEPVGTGAAAAAIAQQSVSPYVLLDLRDSDDYDRCHINGAINFPVARLNRSTNTYTPAILAFLNQPGKIVIVYDEDEKIACDAATTICRRGGENVFLLSGGLRVLAEKFPGGEFITGPLPAHLRPGRSSSRSSSRQTSTSSLASTGSSSGGTAGQAAAVVRPGGGFTREEVERIRMQLEENLLADDGKWLGPRGHEKQPQTETAQQHNSTTRKQHDSHSSNDSNNTTKPHRSSPLYWLSGRHSCCVTTGRFCQACTSPCWRVSSRAGLSWHNGVESDAWPVCSVPLASSMASTMRSTRKSSTGSVAGSRTASRTASRAGSRAGARTSSSSSEAKVWR
eukprot:m.89984 g.89984  ORF g.89984 m.89984 type:complete len:424 (+) comp14990_c0_seq5:561-1832(+)